MPGDEVTITGASGAYDWKNLGDVKSFDPAKISSIAGKEGATVRRDDYEDGRAGKFKELSAPTGTVKQHASAEFSGPAAYEIIRNGQVPEWMLKNDTVRNELFMQAAKDMAGMIDMKAKTSGQLKGYMGVEGKAGLEIFGAGGGAVAGARGEASLTRDMTKNMSFTEFSNIYEKYKDKGIGEVNKQLSGFMGNVENKAQDHDFVTKTAKALEDAENKLKGLFVHEDEKKK